MPPASGTVPTSREQKAVFGYRRTLQVHHDVKAFERLPRQSSSGWASRTLNRDGRPRQLPWAAAGPGQGVLSPQYALTVSPAGMNLLERSDGRGSSSAVDGQATWSRGSFPFPAFTRRHEPGRIFRDQTSWSFLHRTRPATASRAAVMPGAGPSRTIAILDSHSIPPNTEDARPRH